jgi:ABC-type phosphate/phosphonate transport system substrate-binding protein
MLRLLTYLAPSIPADFFRLVADVIAADIGVAVELQFEQRISGPLPGDANPLAEGTADIAFVCAPSYRWQRESLELLPVPVPTDARAAGRPVYFGDVVVRRTTAAESVGDLRGGRWAFNDRNSRSGWFCMLERIAPAEPSDYFGEVIDAGSHLESLRLIRAGLADAAAIDSNALRFATHNDPSLLEELRVLESWGPFPIQPVVMRSTLAPALQIAVRGALLRAHERVGDSLRQYGFVQFVEARPADYDR